MNPPYLITEIWRRTEKEEELDRLDEKQFFDYWLKTTICNSTQQHRFSSASVVPKPATSASPGSWFKPQIHRPPPLDPLNQQPLFKPQITGPLPWAHWTRNLAGGARQGGQNLCSKKAPRRLQCLLKFGNHCSVDWLQTVVCSKCC